MVDATIFQSIVSALQYFAFTKLDNIHAINKVCQHISNPTLTNLKASKWMLRYLQGYNTLVYDISTKVLFPFTALVMFTRLAAQPNQG